MAKLTLSVTFDGTTDIARQPGRSPVEWNIGQPSRIGFYDVFWSTAGTGDTSESTATFQGKDWQAKAILFAGDSHKSIIRDGDGEANRRIDLLELGYNSDVSLISTRAGFIFGWDGDKHVVELGNKQEGSTFAINLYAKENILKTAAPMSTTSEWAIPATPFPTPWSWARAGRVRSALRMATTRSPRPAAMLK